MNRNYFDTRQLYRYSGPAFCFGRYLDNFNVQTAANSQAEAANNIRYQIAKLSSNNVKSISIYMERVTAVKSTAPVIAKPAASPQRTRCEFCGKKLNAKGECPKCDLGEISLDEKIEIHDILNPKLWTEDDELLPEVKEKIIEIVENFKSQLAEDNIKLKVADIWIVGSNANYNYLDESDLDIHILADESNDCDQQHLNLIYDICRRNFNSKYDITFNDINVELYVEDKDDVSNNSAGVYSLKDGWIHKPIMMNIPDIDEDYIDDMVDKLQVEAETIIEKGSIDDIDQFLDKIYDMRIKGFADKGEFDEDNLVFKELRRLGYLNSLREKRINLVSDSLSIK